MSLTALLLTFAAPAGAIPVMEAIIAAPPGDLASVERLLGHSLTRKGGTVFAYYEAANVPLGDGVTVSVDFRQPATSDAQAGAILVLTFEGSCVPRDAIDGHFPGTSMTAGSSHPSPANPFYLERRTNWGRYDFGFDDVRPDCLESFVTVIDKPPAGLTPAG